MLVQHIDITGADRKDVAVHILHFALALDAIAGLQMIAVLKQGFAIGANDGMAHRKAHAVVFGQQAVARAVAPVDETLGELHLLQISDEHRRFS